MSIRRYVPSGAGGPAAVVAVAIAALAGGLIVGVLEGVVDRWFSLFLLFPALIGGAAGGGAAWMVRRQQLRAPVIALLVGMVAGGAGYVAAHTVDYVEFRAAVADSVRAEAPTMTDAAVSAAVDDAIVAVGGEPGVRGYLAIAAREGISVKHMGSADKGLAFTGLAAWLLWLAELLIAAGAGGFLAWAAAREPFCESCKAWYDREQVLAAGGSGTKDGRKALRSALELGDVAGMARALSGPPVRKASFVITSRTCPQCAVDAHCTLKRVTVAKKTKVSILESWLMTKHEATQLRDAATQPR
jgi:hypothetical protein